MVREYMMYKSYDMEYCAFYVIKKAPDFMMEY